MAVGDGGFKTVAVGGFDKNEVNTYISDVRKKMKSMEEDMKANNKKTEEALKLAEEADDRIKAAEKAGEEKLAEVNKQLSIEQERAVKYKTDLDAAKKELEDERKKMSDMLISGKGVSAEAQKAYTEVIDKAKSDAQVIIDEANEKAAAIIAQAEAERAAVQSNNEKFLEALKAQLDAISASYKTVSESAAELLGTEVAAIEVPVIEAPAAKPAPVEVKAAPAPVEEKAEEPAVEEVAEESAPVEEAAEEPAPVEEAAEEPAAQPESASDVPAVDAMPAAEPSDELATFDDAWGGNELAQTIYNNEKENAVPLVNPEQKNLFGEDLFKGGEDIKVEELTDDFEPAADDEIVEEIKPLDVSDVAEAAYNDSFDNDLLSQTMPSGSMGDLNESLLETIKAAEEAFAVKPINTDLDMDDVEEEPSSEDDLMKALREAEAALNSMAPAASVSMDDDVEAVTSTDSSSDSSNPWADLQKQLEAMEQSGNVGDDAPAAESKPAAEEKAPADPAAPSADDSSIWNFGSSSDSSDDDMSGDMFGGFGGF
ncbi:MAG: hypothetical protein E7478_06230 [Ruminococcaceae bacterium]|nr:hypothetical protein [Oscillospiraceae bacterium]